jgi:hypothetical protein
VRQRGVYALAHIIAGIVLKPWAETPALAPAQLVLCPTSRDLEVTFRTPFAWRLSKRDRLTGEPHERLREG